MATTDKHISTCKLCSKRVRDPDKSVKCSLCLHLIHIPCLPTYLNTDVDYANSPTNNWSCTKCLELIFPFNIIENSESFYDNINSNSHNPYDTDIIDNMIFDPFSTDDDDGEGPMGDVDPDQNFLNEVRGNIIKGCNYHHGTTLYEEIKSNSEQIDLSICHLNIRSLPKNLDIFNTTLAASNSNFNLLAFTETWLTPSNVDAHGIKGYSHEYLIRDGKAGGGTSIFITQNWNYKLREDLSYHDNDMELLWLEIDKDSVKTKSNFIIGAIYRRPGSDPRIFIDRLNNTLSTIDIEKKLCLHTGDYNLNLLNSSSHPPTNDFIDINFSHSLFPSINKPTRISENSATLIDNIFINASEIPNSKSGIFLWSISDHFPVFYIHFKDQKIPEITSRTCRTHNATNKVKFTKLLTEIDWTQVTNINDTQDSYTIFHKIISKAYDNAFPMTTTKIGYSNKILWLTSGLKRSIKRKHVLHSIYLKNRSLENKANYTKFKNKLSHILKNAERKNYQDTLEQSKHNLRKSWTIIKDIINKNNNKWSTMR